MCFEKSKIKNELEYKCQNWKKIGSTISPMPLSELHANAFARANSQSQHFNVTHAIPSLWISLYKCFEHLIMFKCYFLFLLIKFVLLMFWASNLQPLSMEMNGPFQKFIVRWNSQQPQSTFANQPLAFFEFWSFYLPCIHTNYYSLYSWATFICMQLIWSMYTEPIPIEGGERLPKQSDVSQMSLYCFCQNTL